MKNKLIGILTLCAVAASCITPVAAIEDDVPIPERLYKKGTDNSSYKSIYALLSYIGIIDTKLEDIKPNKQVTRQEAAVMAASFRAKPAAAVSAPYEDVELTHEAADGISAAKAYGIIEDGARFYPSSAVTTQDAVKWLIRAIGNNSLVYDGDYMSAAEELGMLEGLSAAPEKGLTFAEYFILLENTLNANLADIKMNGAGNIEISVDETNTYLFEKYDIVLQKGIMTSAGYYSSNKNYAGENAVKINSQSYESNGEDLRDMVGKAVWAYTDNSDGNMRLITAWENDKLNTVITAEENDIEDIGKTQIEYDTDGRIKTAKLEETAAVMLNGVYYGSSEKAYINDMYADYDSIELIDNDGNSFIDVIKLEKTEDCVVKMVSSQAERIVFKYNAKDLELGADGHIVTIRDGGEIVGIDSLAENNILTVGSAVTSDGITITEIDVSRKTVKGVLSGTDTEDGKTYYEVNGKSYPLSNEYEKYLKEDTSESKPKNGAEILFYLSVRGEIAASEVLGGYSYGFMQKIYYDGDDETGNVKLYTLTGEFKKYKLYDKVRLITPEKKEGVKYNPEKICEMLSTSNEVVAYKTDSDDTLITEIVLAEDRTAAAFPVESDYPLTKDYICGDTTSTEAKSWLYTGLVANSYTLKNVKAMVYPKSEASRKDEKNYKTTVSVASDYGTDYYFQKERVTLYNVDEFYVPEFATVEQEEVLSNGVNSFNTPVMLAHIEESVNEDDEAVKVLSYYSNGNLVKKTISADADWFVSLTGSEWVGASGGIDTLKTGDIVQFDTNLSGEIVLIRRLFSVKNKGDYRAQAGSDTGPTTLTQESPFQRIAIVYGKVENVKNGYINLDVASPTDKDKKIIPNCIDNTYGRVTYTLYDKSTKKVTPITAADVLPGDEAVIRKRWSMACDIFIYR